MRYGIRKPSIKKVVKAKTVTRAKKAVKGSFSPVYGKKGMGYVRDHKRAVYNKVYKKTSFSLWDLFK